MVLAQPTHHPAADRRILINLMDIFQRVARCQRAMKAAGSAVDFAPIDSKVFTSGTGCTVIV